MIFCLFLLKMSYFQHLELLLKISLRSRQSLLRKDTNRNLLLKSLRHTNKALPRRLRWLSREERKLGREWTKGETRGRGKERERELVSLFLCSVPTLASSLLPLPPLLRTFQLLSSKTPVKFYPLTKPEKPAKPAEEAKLSPCKIKVIIPAQWEL